MPAANNNSIDKRIAASLSDANGDPNDLQALITQVEQTVGSITAERTFSSKAMLDPANSDFAAQKARVDTADLMLQRLAAARPRLQELYDKAVNAAALKTWKADLEALKVIRDEMATRFRERYAACAQEIIGLFDLVAQVDRQVDSLNTRAGQIGAPSQMRTVECAARGMDHLGTTKPISELVRLPMFGLGSGNPGFAWPRPTAPLALQVMAAMPSAATDRRLQAAFERGGSEEYLAVFRKRERDRADRLVEQGQQAERVREQRNAAAADAARARRQA